jgi:hypothetical protein
VELLVVLFCITVLSIPVMLFRAAVLCPFAIRAHGWKRGLYAYKFSLVFAVALAIYVTGTLTGFSWQRMRYVSDEELIRNAIPEAYPGIYKDLADLRVDYPGFAPQVRYWGTWRAEFRDSLLERVLGFASYQVKLPDAVVTLHLDGKARISLGCDGGNCEITAPAHPVFGVIGTVQRDAPSYDIVPEFRAYWSDGRPGDVAKNVHCFSASSQTNPPAALIIAGVGSKPLEIRPRFGFYLVAARVVPPDDKDWVKGAYSARRITRAQFLAWRSCAPSVKSEWPDFAGSWWKP